MKTKIYIIAVLFMLLISKVSLSLTNVSIRLGPSTGQDCNLASYIPTTPLGDYPDLVAAAWTYQGEFNLWRPLFKFYLNEIPQGAEIISARLSLYANPTPCSAPHSGENESYLRKVTSNWSPVSVTWETHPDYSTNNQVLLPESISPSQDYIDIDVTELIREMAGNPSTNFGFIIMNRIENIYRSMNFASSNCAILEKRPKLDITYNGDVSIAPVSSDIPAEFKLSQNFPNPFNPSTTIKFDIPESSHATLKIFDQLGNEISLLINDNLNPGSYEVKWDGSSFSSGAYFVRLESGNNVSSKRIMLIK